MALGNIQWRFQEPVDLHSQINRQADRKAKMWAEMGKNLGGAIQGLHDMKLDNELADMMANAKTSDQLSTETAAIRSEIEKIDARMQEITTEIETLQKQQDENDRMTQEFKIAQSFENELGGRA